MFRKDILLVAVVLVAVVTSISACSSQEPAPASQAGAAVTTGDASLGAAVFQQNCDGCHPGGAQGRGPMLKGKNLSSDHIKGVVRNGASSMPAFPENRISDEQLANLVAYLQSLK
ncbi:MAG: c-type cytochrome [Chloroflexota bacterium]